MSMSRRRAVGLIVAAAVSAGCTREIPRPTTAVHPDLLIVLPGAEGVSYTDEYDGTVSYRLPEPHPADVTIRAITSSLEGRGWKPIADDLMNPGMTNSHARGWMNYIDGTRNNANVFLWSAAWESTRGDRVEYWLRYDYASDSGPMSARPPLQLSAIYLTAPRVNVIRESVRRRVTPQASEP